MAFALLPGRCYWYGHGLTGVLVRAGLRTLPGAAVNSLSQFNKQVRGGSLNAFLLVRSCHRRPPYLC